jgi:N-acetylglucosaminylphosphatidylinositol deacetylase
MYMYSLLFFSVPSVKIIFIQSCYVIIYVWCYFSSCLKFFFIHNEKNLYGHFLIISLHLSFDDKGISGHMNHRALASAMRVLTKNKTNTMIKMAYELKSVSILRKYSSLLDFHLIFISILPRLLHSLLSYIIPFNLISSPDMSYMLLINTPNDYMISRAAFASHQSQYSWDRYIYLIASRYMFINELKYIDKN